MKPQLTVLLIILFFISFQGKTQAEKIDLLLNTPIDISKPSEDCQVEICKSLLTKIEQAKFSIDFAVYGFRGQPLILNALREAQQRGVKIRGIIDKNTDNESYYSDTWRLEKAFRTISSDYEKDRETLQILAKKKWSQGKSKKCERPSGHVGPLQCFEGQGYASKAKIDFKGDIMHNKFFIIDRRYVWTGSANISDTGIGGYNANNAVLIDSQSVANVYTSEFNQMHTGGLYHRSKVVTRKATSVTLNSVPPQHLLIAFSPQDYAVYSAVIPELKAAKESIDVAIFFLTHKNISREIVKAHQRGVKVRIILDATGATNEYSKHKFLRDSGIPLKIETWGGKMHMKSALIDGKHLIIGSMNWTRAGESKNDENTIVLKNYRQANKFKNFYDDLWKSIDDKWLDGEPRPESIESTSSCFDKIDNDFDKKIDHKDNDCSVQ